MLNENVASFCFCLRFCDWEQTSRGNMSVKWRKCERLHGGWKKTVIIRFKCKGTKSLGLYCIVCAGIIWFTFCNIKSRDRVREHEEAMERLKKQLMDAEVRYQQLSKEFAAYREQQNSKPEVRLQSEINLLTLEKVSTASLISFIFMLFSWLKSCSTWAHVQLILPFSLEPL